MATGSKGIHVIAMLEKPKGFEETTAVAEEVSEELVEAEPEKFTTGHYKQKRGQRVFLDVARNVHGQTTVAPYALRARPDAPVAMPVSWGELGHKLETPQDYHIKNIFQRLSHRSDPWKDYGA